MSAELVSQPEGLSLSNKAYQIIARGDLKSLSPDDLTTYLFMRCKAVGLDPATNPFSLMEQQGKLVVYANASCAQQLCNNHNLSTEILEKSETDEGSLYEVWTRISDPIGRSTVNVGIVDITGLRGLPLANAKMKAVTKSFRRTVFEHCGLGMLDETEVSDFTPRSDFPGQSVNLKTGEIREESPSETEEQRKARKEQAANNVRAKTGNRLKEIGYAGDAPQPLICKILGEEVRTLTLGDYRKVLERPVAEWQAAMEEMSLETAGEQQIECIPEQDVARNILPTEPEAVKV